MHHPVISKEKGEHVFFSILTSWTISGWGGLFSRRSERLAAANGSLNCICSKKMAGIFRNSSIESSDPSSSCSKNSLKYGSVCVRVCFCCIEISRTPETGAWFCFFCRNLADRWIPNLRQKYLICFTWCWQKVMKKSGSAFCFKRKIVGTFGDWFCGEIREKPSSRTQKKGWIWVYVPIQWYPMNLMDVTSDTYRLWKMITVVLAILHAPSFFRQKSRSVSMLKLRFELKREDSVETENGWWGQSQQVDKRKGKFVNVESSQTGFLCQSLRLRRGEHRRSMVSQGATVRNPSSRRWLSAKNLFENMLWKPFAASISQSKNLNKINATPPPKDVRSFTML